MFERRPLFPPAPMRPHAASFSHSAALRAGRAPTAPLGHSSNWAAANLGPESASNLRARRPLPAYLMATHQIGQRGRICAAARSPSEAGVSIFCSPKGAPNRQSTRPNTGTDATIAHANGPLARPPLLVVGRSQAELRAQLAQPKRKWPEGSERKRPAGSACKQDVSWATTNGSLTD